MDPELGTKLLDDECKGVEVVHNNKRERFIETMWICACGFLLFKLGTSCIDGSLPYTYALIALPCLLLIVFLLARRVSKHVVRVNDTTVTYIPYRWLGLVAGSRKVFTRQQLGMLVLDTERRCACNPCRPFGFQGIYVTEGFATHTASTQIAFELPIIYNGWTQITRGCIVSPYESFFHKLASALQFKRLGQDSYSRETTVIGGGSAALAAHYTAQWEDSLASYTNYVAINQQALPEGRWRFDKEVEGGRAVYCMVASV
eukprot:GILI01006086.1.p1 GENE.GILI01006086.1~~GILI01006086.1.p1  ORF type:complete len:259 (+),score=32.05 GILI01006086.1:44-820(+)